MGKELIDPIETPKWQYNTIPGNANQGAILMTRNDITQPPFQQNDFVWKAMEDIIGVANMKLEYNESENQYTLYKAKGHRDNEGQWSYTWEAIGNFHEISEAVQEALLNMTYVSYRFDTTTSPGELIIYGVKKDGTEEVVATVATADPAVIADIATRLTNLENNVYTKSQVDILLNGKQAVLTPGQGITITGSMIATNIINDTIESSTTTWSSSTLKALFDALSGVATIIVVSAMPPQPINNTLYYVGNSSPYHIYLRSNDITYDMGTTEIDLSNYYTMAQTDALLLVKANVGDSYTRAEDDALLAAKQDTLTPGNGIDITSNTVSTKIGNTLKFENGSMEVDYNTTNLKKDSNNKLDTVLQTWTGTQAEYDLIATKDPNTLYMIHQ